MDNNYNNGQQGGQQNGPVAPQSGESNTQQNGPVAPQSGESNAQQNGPVAPQSGESNAQQNNYQMPYGQPYIQNPNQFYGQVNSNGTPQPSDEGIGLSIASMILGILAIIFSCCFYPLAFLLALIGFVLGAVGLKKGAGKGMAITGIVLSIISIAIAILVIVSAVSFASLFK